MSRGGLKLAGALDAFQVDPAGRIVIDVGASTGGFTDVLLQRGALPASSLSMSATANSPGNYAAIPASPFSTAPTSATCARTRFRRPRTSR